MDTAAYVKLRSPPAMLYAWQHQLSQIRNLPEPHPFLIPSPERQ